MAVTLNKHVNSAPTSTYSTSRRRKQCTMFKITVLSKGFKNMKMKFDLFVSNLIFRTTFLRRKLKTIVV